MLHRPVGSEILVNVNLAMTYLWWVWVRDETSEEIVMMGTLSGGRDGGPS